MINYNRPFGEIDSIYDRQHFNRQLNRDYEYKPQINHKISQTVIWSDSQTFGTEPSKENHS